MRRTQLTINFILSAFIAVTSSMAAITGQWDFNNIANPLTGSIGEPITYLDGPGGATESTTQFGTTTSFGIPNVAGTEATVMKFGTNGFNKGYAVPHGLTQTPTFNVNEWTIIMDVLFPASSANKWRALFQTFIENPSSDDAEMYLDEANRLGINGVYHGTVGADTWVRLAFVAVASDTTTTIRKYINGVKVGENSQPLDGEFSLTPASTVLLFTDGYENEVYTQPGYINSLQIHDESLSDAYIAALGAPSASGIPTQVQTRPFLRSISPIAGTNRSPAISFSAAIEDGITGLDTNTVRLFLNDEQVTPLINVTTTNTLISFDDEELFAPGSTNTWQFIFADDAPTPTFSTNTIQIVVNHYSTINLPDPLFLETFESAAEGSLPNGWTSVSFTDISSNFDEDLNDLNSASYANWIVLDSDRFKGSFVTYSNPNNPQSWEDDYQRVLNYVPAYVVNGDLVTELADGKIAFANSGYRNGVGQFAELYSPDFNLSTQTNVFLVFNSIWEQNQDSIAGVEYSTDQGQTWKPVVYYVDQANIIAPGNQVDPAATFTQQLDEHPLYFDEFGSEHGTNYSDFIKAPVSAVLASHISGRQDDDSFGSKRLEMFRLPDADNKSTVRLRFFHAGEDSWYFGIDNVGLYSIAVVERPSITLQPESTTATEGSSAALTVVATGTDLAYQWFFNSSEIPGANGSTLSFNRVALTNAGSYFVLISNPGGATNSATVTLTINPRPPSELRIWQFNNSLDHPGTGSIVAATPETAAAITYGTANGIEVPLINGEAPVYLDFPAMPPGTHGLHLTMPTAPNSGGDYLNEYTMIWDVLVPETIGWTPLFNSAPDNGNDADFYITDTGALGIAALGYSADGLVQVNQWYRIAFVADLALGEVTYYVNGAKVHKRTGGSLRDGRFALYTGNDAGPDVLLFTEPSGDYNHRLLANSFLFVDRAFTPEQIASLNGPTAGGIVFGNPRLSVSPNEDSLTISWSNTNGGRLQRTTSLTNPDWQDVTVPVGATSVTEPTTGTSAFYRWFQP
jgi:hypothetical protein